MNISKTTLKYYGIPLVIALIIIIVVLLVPVNKNTVSPTPTQPPVTLPTAIPTIPLSPATPAATPTILPVPTFTGANDTQVIPPGEKDLGMQKTALRLKAPLTLPFGTIRFDYNTDSFTLTLNAGAQKADFINWLTQNYPAIPESQFIMQ